MFRLLSEQRKRLDFLSNAFFMGKYDDFGLQRSISKSCAVKGRGARKHSRIIRYTPVPTISENSEETALVKPVIIDTDF